VLAERVPDVLDPTRRNEIRNKRPIRPTALGFRGACRRAGPFGPDLLAQSRLPVFRTVICRSCHIRREGTKAEGALPATVAPAGEVRGTGRQARPFLFFGLGNPLRIEPAAPPSDASSTDRPCAPATPGRARWFDPGYER
jgi:hypothetical protein